MKILEWLEEQLAAIDATSLTGDIGSPGREGDDVLFIIEDERLRRLLVLKNNLIDECQQQQGELMKQVTAHMAEEVAKMVDNNIDPDNTKITQLLLQREILYRKLDFVDKLFWVAVWEEVEAGGMLEKVTLDQSEGLGIRDGWQVVALPLRNNPGLTLTGPSLGLALLQAVMKGD